LKLGIASIHRGIHRGTHRAGHDANLTPFIWEALRLNPPVAYLPRRCTRPLIFKNVIIPAGSELVIAVGAGWLDVRFIDGGVTQVPTVTVEVVCV
jgi:cytochrome P450